jgi:ABC-type amino acid transport substrate-binding protein
MKNVVLLFFWFSIFLSNMLHAQTLSGDTWAKVQQQGSGTIVLTYIKAPYLSFLNGNNQLEGICADIVKSFIDYIKIKKGIIIKAKVMPVTIDFNQFLNTIKSAQGGVFGLGNITITEARQQQFSFTKPFLNNVAFLLSHNSVVTLRSLKEIAAQFKLLKAYTVKGTTNEARIQEIKQKYFPNLQIQYVATSGDALQKVATDSKSFTSLDFSYYLEAGKYQNTIKRHPVGDNASEKFGIIMPLNSDWKSIWDEFFTQTRFTKSIEFRKILNKHLGTNAADLLEQYQD